ncbi:hypothetical protein AB0H18_22845 [Streptomyces sp. NPDC020766]|uniref:hypothetical protein n=1 Tax=Streptomyces sp. NPDC020766 TaxID=3155011 RepID=UPI003408D303
MKKILLIRRVGYGIDASNHWALADPEYVRATAFGTISRNVIAPSQPSHVAQVPLAEAAARKELATAAYISAGLVWHLRHMAALPRLRTGRGTSPGQPSHRPPGRDTAPLSASGITGTALLILTEIRRQPRC